MDLIFLTLIALLIYLLFKYVFLPAIIPFVIWYIPMEKDPSFQKLQLEFTEKGLKLGLKVAIGYTQLPLSFLWLKATIRDLTIYDHLNNSILARVSLPSPIFLDGKTDMIIDQDGLEIDWRDTTSVLRHLMECVKAGGLKELQRITLRLAFTLDLNLCGLELSSMKCEKMINIGAVEKLKQRKSDNRKWWQRIEMIATAFFWGLTDLGGSGMDLLRERSRKEKEISEGERQKSIWPPATLPTIPTLSFLIHPILRNLFPNPELTPFVDIGGVLRLGSELRFSDIPGFKLDMGIVEWTNTLNGVSIGKARSQAFNIGHNLKLDVAVGVDVWSASNGIAAASGLMRGAALGFGQGMLYDEWGKNFAVVGIKNVSVKNPLGQHIQWIDKVMDNFEFDLDLGALVGCYTSTNTPFY